MLQRLRLYRTSDTVFRREIHSRRQWGYGTCYGGIVSPLRRSVLLTHIFTQPEGTQQPYNMLTTSHLHRYTTQHKNANNTYLVRGRGSQQPATDTENRHRKNSVTLMFTRSNTNAVCLFQLAEYSACSSQKQYPSHSTLSDSTPAIQ